MNQAIYKMGIYELRTLAREMGVPSPTTLKRQQLIDSIIEISKGEKKAVKGLTRGRKPKNTESISNILQRYSDCSNGQDNVSYIPNNFPTPTLLQVSIPSQVFVNDLAVHDGVKLIKNGIVQVLPSGIGEIKLMENQTITVPKNLIENYAIESGKNLQVFCVENPDKQGSFIATDINQDGIIQSQTKFNSLLTLPRTKKIDFQPQLSVFKQFFEKNSVLAGQCVIVTYAQDVNPEIIVTELTHSVQDAGAKKVALFSNQLDYSFLKNDFNNYYSMSVLDNAVNRLKNIELAIDAVKKYAEQGNDCVFMLGNLSTIFNTCRHIFIGRGQSELFANESAIQFLYSLLGTAKQTEKGSVTILAIEQENNDKYKDCMSMFNAFINIEKCDENNKLKLKNSFSIYN